MFVERFCTCKKERLEWISWAAKATLEKKTKNRLNKILCAPRRLSLMHEPVFGAVQFSYITMRPFACRRHESYHFQGVITPFCKLRGALPHCITDMKSTLKAMECLSTSHPISADPFQLPHLAKILIRPLSQPVIAVLISIPVMSFGRLHFHISKMSARVFFGIKDWV